MASLQPQVYINPEETYFLTRDNTNFISPTSFVNTTQNTKETIIVNGIVCALIFQDASGNRANRIIQDEISTTFYIGSVVPVAVLQNTLDVTKRLQFFDASGSGKYMQVIAASTLTPGIIQSGDGSGIQFLKSGMIQTGDTLQIGTTNNATLTVGPSADQVVMEPDFYSFSQKSGIPVGGLYRESQTINIYSGTDPYYTSNGLRVSPITIAFGKIVDAVRSTGYSMTAQGNIVSTNTFGDVGGQFQAINGNYTLTMTARGDAHSPNGTGGVITASSTSIAPLTLNTGLNSNIVGPSSGLLTLTATNTINLNAPNVFTNGGPLTNVVWYYQTAANSSVAGHASVLWTANTYIQPGLPNPMNSTGAAWSAPFSGLYFVSVSLYIGTAGNQLYLVYSINSPPYRLQVGTPMYTANAFTVSMSCYVQLTAGQSLSVITGSGSAIIIQQNAGFSIQYISP
jgi:hypothetical protein